MARGGVNKAVVQIARTAILARGEHPSIDAVRIEMGNTGSKTTIHRYLKELDETDSRRVIQRLIDVRLTDDTDDATHATQPLLYGSVLSTAHLGWVAGKRCSLNGISAGTLIPLASH